MSESSKQERLHSWCEVMLQMYCTMSCCKLTTKASSQSPSERLTLIKENDVKELTLCDAVRLRDSTLLVRLLSLESESNLLQLKQENPVQLACTLGYADMVKVFLDNGCSPNLPTKEGRMIHTVLSAIKSGDISREDGHKLVDLLCSAGCDVNLTDSKSDTTLLYVAELGDAYIMKKMLPLCSEMQLTRRCGGSKYTPLHMSAMRGDLACVRLLLSQTPSKHINITDVRGNSALLLAMKAMLHSLSYLNDAKVLFDKERLESTKSQRDKLLQFQYNSVGIVEALLTSGADPNIRIQPFSLCCLHLALQLCTKDQTGGFVEVENKLITPTMQRVAADPISKLATIPDQEVTGVATSVSSLYAGVVRLLVLSGADLGLENKATLLFQYGAAASPLIEEIYEFWEQNCQVRPPPLVHLTKQRIRVQLANCQQLHRVDCLPLPWKLKEYIKLNCL